MRIVIAYLVDSSGVLPAWFAPKDEFATVTDCCVFLRDNIHNDGHSIFAFTDNGKILSVSKQSALVQQYLTFK